MRQSQITEWCHSIICSQVKEGGNGHDTLFLCQLAGENGEVWAFDIQEQAVRNTESLLARNGYGGRAHLVKDGHENMDRYFVPGTADLICFNFGYLPGGDHRIATKPETSIAAIRKGLDILKSGGMMSLCIYSGGETGFEEKERILEYLRTLSPQRYTVIAQEYYNRGNYPPLPVFIFAG